MFRRKDEDTLGNTPCLTLWGLKDKCYSTTYDVRVNDLFVMCPERRDRFRAAQAFAIIFIVIFCVECVLGFVQLCCCTCLRWVCLALNILGIFSCIPWTLMCVMYFRNTESSSDWWRSRNCTRFNTDYKYGAGFALLVTAWCVNTVNIVFIMLPC
ncbi:amastin-like protein [Leptomonas seymouri]|nr:amastin-like protein [Leptomonas seymouri]|eukprot:KPI85577.1 amastin-like protein [Leptomonas seymouri]